MGDWTSAGKAYTGRPWAGGEGSKGIEQGLGGVSVGAEDGGRGKERKPGLRFAVIRVVYNHLVLPKQLASLLTCYFVSTPCVF